MSEVNDAGAASSDEPAALQAAVYLDDLLQLADLLRQPAYSSEGAVDAPDLHGNSALHLATMCRNTRAIDLLLAHGAQPKVKNRNGWNVIQEAVATDDEDVIASVYKGLVQAAQTKLPAKLAKLTARLEANTDFYLEINFQFKSWLPFVSRFCPEDTYRIWKRGSSIRVDTTIVGFNNMKWQRGALSIIYHGGLLWIVDFDEGSYLRITPEVQLKRAGEAAADEASLRKDVMNLCGALSLECASNFAPVPGTDHRRVRRLYNPTMRTDTSTEHIAFKPTLDWMWREKTEAIGPWRGKLFGAAHIHFLSVSAE
eukprot:SAG11_NODE_4147_length_2041_cov_1.797631_3_plen_312_part_00